VHVRFRSFPVSRTALLRFIVEHCFTDEERKGTAQSIIYKSQWGIVWFGTQHPAGYYHTKGFATSDLIQRYMQAFGSRFFGSIINLVARNLRTKRFFRLHPIVSSLSVPPAAVWLWRTFVTRLYHD
jgi:hypothetical protein